MKSIWYFVGLMLLITGAIICLSGIYFLINPQASTTVLSETHPSIWWGGLMVVAGFAFFWKNRKVIID